MGNEAVCSCMNDPRGYQKEFTVGEGVYGFKRIVCIAKYI